MILIAKTDGFCGRRGHDMPEIASLYSMGTVGNSDFATRYMPVGRAEKRNIVFLKSSVLGRLFFNKRKEI
jgi:hypothetical protein